MTDSTTRYRHDGLNLAYQAEGAGSVLLLVHGFPLNRSMWRRVGGFDGYRTVAPDLRGMGESEASAANYSMAAYADDLLALLDVLGDDRAVLCGLSMGGYIVFEVLRRAPERVAGLILMDTKAAADDEPGRQGRDAMAERVRHDGPAAVVAAMLPKLLDPEVARQQPDLVDLVRRMMEGTPVAGLVGALEAMRDRPDSLALLETVSVPTLVVVGAGDQLTPPAVARIMANGIPGAELEVIPGAGHLPPLERPSRTRAAMGRFLARV